MEIWSTVLLIGGILIGLTVFLYILPMTRREAKDKHYYTDEHKAYPDISYRKCPVCGAKLKENEAVYSITYRGQPEDKTFVKGCDYCFDPRTGKRLIEDQ